MKTGRILEEEGVFEFEYDNTLGQKNLIRLDAQTYAGAVREARSYLGIDAENRDAEGAVWEIE